MDSALLALTERYRASLTEKCAEVARVYLASLVPGQVTVNRILLQSLLDRLSGSAGSYGFAALGEAARVVCVMIEKHHRVLVPAAPGRNLGFVLYGAGAASLAAVAALVWVVRDRPALTRGQTVPLAWTALGFAAFSALSRGASRYFTPVWPGMAMLGGLWTARAIRDRLPTPEARRRWVVGLTAGMLLLAAGQSAWYGPLRARAAADRSPRGLVGAALGVAPPDRLATFEFQNPAVSYYAGRTVPNFDHAPGATADGASELLSWAARTPSPAVLITRRETPGVGIGLIFAGDSKKPQPEQSE